jgi:A/G-specific adenine glycosylase
LFKNFVPMNQSLIKWYLAEKRALPWRLTKDAYYIWLSEIILQQTRVDQGLSYYVKFIELFPSVFDLAMASEEQVLKAWQGLGYYSRARNLHHTAQVIVTMYAGVFPSTFEQIQGLKGIGPYTAAAIASIAFNQPYPVCDGNVERVVSRYLALQLPPKQAAAQKVIHDFLNSHIDRKRPGDFNQGMMELGALVCKPTHPECAKCPIRKDCKAFVQGLADSLPVKTEKAANPIHYYHYLVIHPKGEHAFFLNKRTGNGIWKNLWDFPLIETRKPQTLIDIKKTTEWLSLFEGIKMKTLARLGPVTHKLTHRELMVHFIEIEISQKTLNNPNYVKVSSKQHLKNPVPQLIANYLKKHYPDTL